MRSTKFSAWLEQKYISWLSEAGHLRTLKDFAGWLGIGNAVLSHYLRGSRKPSADQLEKIADKLGMEAYDLLDQPRPDPVLVKIKTRWDKLNEEQKRKIEEILEDS